MADIILSGEQTAALNQSTGQLTVLDANGFVVGLVQRGVFTKEQISEAQIRAKSNGPWHTTEEVLTRLKALESK